MSIESKLREYIQKLSDPASINQLFTQDIIQKYTDYETAEDFFFTLGVTDQETYDIWADNPSDSLIRVSTSLNSWDELFVIAAKELARTRQLMLREGRSTELNFSNETPFAKITINVSFHAA